QYPSTDLPPHITHTNHVYPSDHAAFYCSSRATLNLTRRAMRNYGWAPSTCLFQAAACGACISDTWSGLEQLLEPDKEVLLAEDRQDVPATPRHNFARQAVSDRRGRPRSGIARPHLRPARPTGGS